MHLHVISGFPRIPLLRRELVSIVPGRFDRAGGNFPAGGMAARTSPHVPIRFLEELVAAFRNKIGSWSGLIDLTANPTRPSLRLQ